MKRSSGSRCVAIVALASAVVMGAGLGTLFGSCGPYTDVAADGFCSFVLEIFYLGITTGTTPTTFDPASNVTRLQMAAFLSRTVDSVLKRGSRRAAMDQYFTPQNSGALGVTSLPIGPRLLKSDGADIWVAGGNAGGPVARVRASDGKFLETWTGATGGTGVLVAMGRVFITGNTSPGNLYRIDPSQPPGAVTTVASDLGNIPQGITFDGSRIWVANFGASVSIVTPGVSIPWTVTTVTTGFAAPVGAIFDGANLWVTDSQAGKLHRLDSGGAILQSVTVGNTPLFPAFDGSNIWVPNVNSNSTTVVRASNGAVLATLTASGFSGPRSAAFDGERLLFANINGDSVSLWKAADLSFLGSFGAGSQPWGVCSDGVNFWISFQGSGGQLRRF